MMGLIRTRILWMVLFASFILKANGQETKPASVYYTAGDRAIFEQIVSEIGGKKNLPTAGLLIETGRFFLGTPYVAATLEREPEQLVVNLRELDCTTFVENVLALTLTLQEEKPTFEGYCNNLRKIRYRNEEITDYTDRLHYTTDWLYENERRGILKDINRGIGGEPLSLELSFMSTHPDSYKQLKENPERIRIMAEKEKEISGRSHYYIPEEKIDSLGKGMENGDIVSFVTSIKGLDVSHIGFIYRDGEKLTFIHASSSAKKVLVNEVSLADYVAKIKSNKGVLIARVLNH